MTSFRLLGASARRSLAHSIRILSNLVCALLIVSAPTFAATFYVDNSGSPACSDSTTSGSQTKPWCTVNYGVSHINSGDTLYVKNGTYNEGFTITGPSGTAAAHTVISAYPGHTPILKGSGFSSGRMKITGGCSYIDFIGFEITNYNQGLYLDDDAGTSTPCTNLLVSGIHIHDVGQEGLAVRAGAATGARNFVIQNSEIDHTGRLGSVHNGEGMYVGASSGTDNTNGVTILDNKIHDTQDECIELKGDSHDIVVDGNNIYSCLSPGSSFGNNGGAIEIDEPRNSSTNPNHIIRNNVVHDLALASGITKRGIRAGTGATIYNNVLYNIASSYTCILSNTANYNRIVYHNTIDCTTANAFVNSGTTADSKNNIGPNTTNNVAINSAYFTNYAGHIYTLVPGAAPVNIGVNLTTVAPFDINGVSRVLNLPSDLGAYELVGTGGTGDTTAPTVPASVSATAVSSSSINLTWAASTDNVGVNGYRIFRGGTQVATAGGTSYSDTGLSASTPYTYTVAAVDAAGNASAQSAAAQATTLSTTTGGPQTTANSCSQADVQTAINQTASGGTVQVPAGSCTWLSTITISGKALTLKGAGIGQTNITDQGSGGAALLATVSTANLVRVTGFTFIKSTDHSNGIVQFEGAVGQVNAFRFDHNRILQATSGSRGVGGIGVWGLIDNNTFDDTAGSGSIQQIAFLGSSDGSDGGFTPWTLPTTLGTANAVYIEDNVFNNNGNQAEDIIDGYGGVRYVIRHNTFNDKGIGFHGTDSGNRRSLHSAEIYNNIFVNNGGSNTYAIRFRGGTGVIFNNTASGSKQIGGIEFWSYRSCPRDGSDTSGWQACNGTNWELGSTSFSTNESRQASTSGGVRFCSGDRDLVCTTDSTCSSAGKGTCSTYLDGSAASGYMCRDQVGTGHGQVSMPIYVWNNTGMSAGANDGPASCSPSTLVSSSIIVRGRNFVDNGTPMPGYVPYVYPHPLQGSGADSGRPTAPTNLAVSVR